MEWTEANTLRFIDFYRAKRVLWDAKHPQHYNKITKLDAWEEIAEIVGHSVDRCKQKMVTLLSAMRREKSKIKKSMGTGKGAHEVYKSSWYAYESLKFILDKDTPRPTNSSIKIEENSEITDTYEQSLVTESGEIPWHPPSPTMQRLSQSLNPSSPSMCSSSTSLHPSSPSNQPLEQPCPSLQPTSSYIQQFRPSASSRKRKKQTEHDWLHKAFMLLNAASASNSANDESQYFGNFIAKKLRKYPTKTQSSIQNAIMGVFLNADNGLYDEHNPT